MPKIIKPIKFTAEYQTVTAMMDKWPPFLVYAIARKEDKESKKVVELTAGEISRASGISIRHVIRTSGEISWERIVPDLIDRFCFGCNFNFFDTAHHEEFIKRTLNEGDQKFPHLSPQRLESFQKKANEYEARIAKQNNAKVGHS